MTGAAFQLEAALAKLRLTLRCCPIRRLISRRRSLVVLDQFVTFSEHTLPIAERETDATRAW
jgi:hypothetical protein